MTNLISITDFVYPYKLVVDSEENLTRINELIAFYQEAFLRKVLGFETLNDFEQNYNSIFWQKFINGELYTVDGIIYNYSGIKKPLAMYCFVNFIEHLQYRATENGFLISTQKNGTAIMPYTVIVTVNNKLCELNFYETGFANVYHFLTTNSTSVPAWVFSPFKAINRFDL